MRRVLLRGFLQVSCWTLGAKIPDLPEEDIGSFLETEAERGFPYGPESLSLAVSRYSLGGGEKHATLVGIPRNHLQASCSPPAPIRVSLEQEVPS